MEFRLIEDLLRNAGRVRTRGCGETGVKTGTSSRFAAGGAGAGAGGSRVTRGASKGSAGTGFPTPEAGATKVPPFSRASRPLRAE